MDYEKYYDERDENYVVHFGNNKGFSENMIMKMFSSFGKVANVNLRGKSHGLCFVSYKNLEDVKRCIDGFRKHKIIKILPHKNKYNSGAIKKKADKDNGKFINEQDSLSDLTQMIFSEEDKFKDQQSDVQSNLSVTCKLDTSTSSRASNKSLNETEKILDDTQIPPFISIDKNCTRSCSTSTLCEKVFPAEEVIVANIHPSLSIHYILHLFEKYNPIAISQMMTTPITGISYCHVYYKTRREANATTEEFDMCCLFGKCLIVLTFHRLIQEALQL